MVQLLKTKGVDREWQWVLNVNNDHYEHCRKCGVDLKGNGYYCRPKDEIFCKECMMSGKNNKEVCGCISMVGGEIDTHTFHNVCVARN